jgi:hypothetical protein
MTNIAALSADALEVNRQGRLTDDQRKGWAGAERAWRSDFGFAALVCAFLGLGLLTGFLSNKADPTRILGGLGLLVAAGVLGYVAVFLGQPLARDLRDGRVASIEGPIGRERMAGSGGQPASHWLDVDGKRFACGLDAYEAAEQPGIVRLYYLPRSRKAVNFERLPDRPLPAGAVNGSLVASTARSALSLDRRTHDEALATMVAMEHAVTAPDLPPPDAPRDPRPLAEAIVGAWSSPAMSVMIDADGSARATMANGMSLAGRWSVDRDGKLRLDGMGDEMVTEARLAGDTLTVVMDGMPLSFRRSAG